MLLLNLMKMTEFEHLTMNSSLDLHENRITYRKRCQSPAALILWHRAGLTLFYSILFLLKKIESNSHNKIGRQ